ncbi:MAG TPA: GAF domain-containing sensor histidine kinase, partial [Ktedonobacteraceae bacterium]
ANLFISLLATGLIAVLFQPLRLSLQRAVNRLMFGERDNPYHVISHLGQRLETTLVPEAVLPMIVETVNQALKLPYAAITLKQGDEFPIVASHGEAGEIALSLPLVYQAETIGQLLLAPRTRGEAFTSADRSLLDDLARQAGIAAHAVRLTTELQLARARLVTTREEERRRLRRDLHDGLGPQLAGLTLKLETARNRLAYDTLADTLLSDLTTRTQAAVTDIRRLVYALRPPALDELGLLPALREQALQYSDQGDNGLHISIDAPDCLPELSAAVEVAVYRIAQEALTNVVHHARARHCVLRLVLDETAGRLTLEVQDDGVWMTPTSKKGVGLVSMRERAEELGGTWTMKQAPTGGTCVLVQLPYRPSTSPGTMEQQSNSQLPEEED